jgi:hypothetical protein
MDGGDASPFTVKYVIEKHLGKIRTVENKLIFYDVTSHKNHIIQGIRYRKNKK